MFHSMIGIHSTTEIQILKQFWDLGFFHVSLNVEWIIVVDLEFMKHLMLKTIDKFIEIAQNTEKNVILVTLSRFKSLAGDMK